MSQFNDPMQPSFNYGSQCCVGKFWGVEPGEEGGSGMGKTSWDILLSGPPSEDAISPGQPIPVFWGSALILGDLQAPCQP